jgi:hypothetical protein
VFAGGTPVAGRGGAGRRQGAARAAFVARNRRFVAFPARWRALGNTGGMRTPFLAWLFLAVAVAGCGADRSLEQARRARDLLGPGGWAQVIRIENAATRSPYPRELHALVFELAGLLWFYTPVDGTQSFSLHRGRLAEEKADFAPLLRDIEPGFARWTVVDDGQAERAPVAFSGPLRNGCFIESCARLRRLVEEGAEIGGPRLLMYYHSSDGGPRGGHTVLAYEEAGALRVYDPDRPRARLAFAAGLGADPRRLADAVQGQTVAAARVLPLEVAAVETRGLYVRAEAERPGQAAQ